MVSVRYLGKSNSEEVLLQLRDKTWMFDVPAARLTARRVEFDGFIGEGRVKIRVAFTVGESASDCNGELTVRRLSRRFGISPSQILFDWDFGREPFAVLAMEPWDLATALTHVREPSAFRGEAQVWQFLASAVFASRFVEAIQYFAGSTNPEPPGYAFCGALVLVPIVNCLAWRDLI